MSESMHNGRAKIRAHAIARLEISVRDGELLIGGIPAAASFRTIARYTEPGHAGRSPARKRMHLLLKRCLDILGASAALVLLGPLLLFVAIAIKLTSSGPVLFVQPREGRHGQLFNAYKFRSMYQDLCDGSGISHTCDEDPRITPVGRFIRKTSIDELPQILNVLKGEMSLVGPRPHVPGMLVFGRKYSDVVPYYTERHAMRPGITGLAQASGLRGEVSSLHLAKARVDFDIAYTQNFSIWLDLTILWRTALREFVTGNGV